MATKKKATKSVIGLTPVVGDSVSVIAATIFDNDGKLSDLCATGTITRIDPKPGWDYEVTFDGVLSLEGRGEIKSRLYNKHQVVRTAKVPDIPVITDFFVYKAVREEGYAVESYNCTVKDIKEIGKRVLSTSSPDKVVYLYSEREHLLSALTKEEARVKAARKQLAVEIRRLLAEYPEE